MTDISETPTGGITLFVACPDAGSVPSGLTDLLRVAEPSPKLVATGSIPEALQRAAGASIIVLLSHPVRQLSQLLESGHEADEALSMMIDINGAWLADLRRARRQIVLLDRDELGGEVLPAILSERLGLNFPNDVTCVAAEMPVPSVLQAFAILLLQASEQGQDIIGELEAALAIPSLAGSLSHREILQVLAQLGNFSGNDHAEDSALSEAAEQLNQEHDRLRAEVALLREDIVHQQDIAKQREAVLGTALLDREARLEAMAEQYAEQSAQLQRAAAAHEELQRTTEELSAVYRSHSWKVTEPMRAVRRKLSKS